MARKLIDALLLVTFACAGATALGDDDDARTPSHHRERAADLNDCCTPGDEDFPKVGGNLGNQNYSALRQINKGRIRRLGAAWSTTSRAASPPAPTRALRWWWTAHLHRVGIRQRGRRRRKDRRHALEVHADARQT